MGMCEHCGRELAADATFCRFCGARQAETVTPATPELQARDAPPPRKAKSGRGVTALAVALAVAVVLGGGAVALVYNNNYRAVLAAFGLDAGKTESTEPASGTEPGAAALSSGRTEQTQAAPSTQPETTTGPPTTTLPPFIPSNAPPPGSGELYKVATLGSPLRIRTGPGTDYPVAGNIPNGSLITVELVMEKWAYVTYLGVTGWCSLDYLQPMQRGS